MPPPPPPTPRSFQQRLEACGLAFSRCGDVGASSQALARMAAEAADLTGTARAAIWLHDRRARDLWLAAEFGAAAASGRARVPAGHPDALPALGLTIDRPRWLPAPHATSLVAPLRGWRRALGTLVLDDVIPGELSPHQILELAGHVARQLSAAVENIQLIEEVVRQHRLLHDSFDSLVDLVIVTDTQASVIQMNAAAGRYLGHPSGDICGTPLAALVGDELATWAIASTGAARTHTFCGTPLGETVVVTVTALVSGDRASMGRVLVARDVTETRRLEAERQSLQDRLAQSEKLAALGQFVAGVAHEINNPLQGVLGNVELLLRSSNDPGQRADLRRILHEADRAAKIVRNLLVFSGVRRTIRRRLTVEGLISRVLITRRANLAERRIEVIRHHPGHRPRVLGDALMLQQALLNILLNAEHAIAGAGADGTIDISTELSDDGQTIVTRIHDSGPGIEGSVLTRIFDPFFTTKEVDKGTGLGLTIAYGIVKDHGGALHAANLPQGGAQFTIELPVAAGGATRPRPGAATARDA